MELDEMKIAWTEMSAKMEQQKKLTDQLIMDMTKVKYNSLLSKISTYETMGTVVCYACVAYLLYRFDRFDTPFLVFCASTTILLFTLLPILSLWSIATLRTPDIGKSSSKELMEKYLKGRRRFVAVQKFNLVMGAVLIFTCAPISFALFSHHHLINVWTMTFIVAVGGIFFVIFSRPVYLYYVRTIQKLEGVLKELE